MTDHHVEGRLQRRRPRARGATTCIPLRADDLAGVVAAALAHEQWAWTALVTSLRPAVLAVARRHGLGAADQDDVAQRTWLLLFRHLHRIETPAAVAGWATTTARREALRVLEERRREVPTEPHELPESAEHREPESELVAGERAAALDSALDRVPEHQRALLRLMLRRPAATYEQIAAALGIPVGSIGPTRARGIARLRGDARLSRTLRGHTAPQTEERS